MRFLIFNHRYAPFPGGSELVVQRLAEHLAEVGHSVSAVVTDAYDLEALWDPSRERVDAPTAETMNRVKIRRVPMAYRPMNNVLFPVAHRLQGELARLDVGARVQRQIARWILGTEHLMQSAEQFGPPDLVIVTNLGLEALAIEGAALAARWGVPYLVIPFLHLGPNDNGTTRRYASMAHQVELLQEASGIICMTELEATYIRKLGVTAPVVAAGAGFDAELTTGGDGQRFRSRRGIEGYLIGALGALATDKGTKDTIKAVRILRRRGMNVSAAFAGPVLQDFGQWFSALDKREKEGIHLLGVVTDAERRDLLAALDTYVMPSRTESFGIVYLEAWANGCPVIAADAGAVPELVQDGQRGVLVPFGRPGLLANAIQRLIENPGVAKMLADAGRRLAFDSYTWPVVLAGYEHAIEQALGHGISDEYDESA